MKTGFKISCLAALALCLLLPFFTSCSKCKHKTTEWVVEEEATCSVAGWQAKTCSDCGEAIERKQYTVKHQFEGGVCAICGAAEFGSEYLKFSKITLRGVEGYEVSGRGNSNETAVEIPALHNGKPVLSIADGAFEGSKAIVSVFVSRNVQVIGNGAFSGCVALSSVTFHEESELTVLGEGAFSGCVALEAFAFPQGVTHIPDSLFAGCTALSEVTIHDGIVSLGEGAFEECESILYTEHGNAKYLGSSGKPYLILADVIDKSVTHLEVPEGTRLLGAGAISGCDRLQEITLPEGVLSLGTYAFAACTSLREVTLPESLQIIGVSAFEGCTMLSEISLPDGVQRIEDHAFYDCTALASLALPDGIRAVGAFAFGQTALTYTEWGGGKYVGNSQNPHLVLVDAAADVTALTVHGNTRVIANGALAENAGNAKLTSLYIGEGVITVGAQALVGCAALEELTFAVTEGWYVAEGYEKNGTLQDVSSPTANADEMGGAKKYYYWYRLP